MQNNINQYVQGLYKTNEFFVRITARSDQFEEGYWGLVKDPDGIERDHIDEFAESVESFQYITDYILEHKKTNDINNILDVGCGNGQYSVFFALLGAIVYGFDISPAGISVANKLARANKVKDMCHFSVQNASSISYPNDSFDIVIFHEVLHHATKYPNVKEEVLRVVKKGGMVICAETLRGNIFFKLGRFFTTRKIKTKGDVELSLSDMESFARGFSEYKIEMMSFLFMIKRVFVKHLNLPLVRWFLLIVKRLDDVILGIFPFLNRYCGECILILKK